MLERAHDRIAGGNDSNNNNESDWDFLLCFFLGGYETETRLLTTEHRMYLVL